MPGDSYGFGRPGGINGSGKSIHYEGTSYLPWTFSEDPLEIVDLPDLYRDPDV
jgi:hypothetical protein